MRRHRAWLMGLGTGLIVGASMLQLITFAQDQENKLARPPLTEEQLAQEAGLAGFLLMTEAQLAARVDAAVAEAMAARDEAADPVRNEDEEEAEPEEDPEPAEQAPDRGVASQASEETYSVYVKYGMTLTEVGNELKKLGLIDDVGEFIEHTREVATRMKVGNAVFAGKPTYEEIMTELTRKKN
ncbi:hypothetical protein ACF3MZ_11545 [Paenibacillaceae bacterium WGS1546]|uniref:hypothetical protein n=1 Tax=Cohnella sp. WGS1546 TaxID=3366810 RepID=UPI00372D80EE